MAAAFSLRADSAAPLERTVEVDDSRILVRFSATDFALGADEIVAWAGRRAQIVRDYYGKFPVVSATLRIRATSGSGVHGGREFSSASPFINISVGREVTRAELDDDWVLVHEMIHLAFPEIGDRHAWLAEGLAVYVEGVARTQAGNETAEEFWAGLVKDMPQGQPQSGDKGLDVTHSWGRTYWGGAIFCLQADMRIRERTGNKKGLQDALRAVLRETGGNTSERSIANALALADAATGTTVLSDLYREYGESSKPFDLDATWRKLGISMRDGRIVFDDQAPLARERRAITRS
ncbi:MAG TPA: hypothetical protein VE046_19190 [Steroidobacteraceae bacterium]|nr:hypothetical protein [Steroidobacteraceae bacterium]